MTTATNNIETKSIMTLASELYAWNCKQDAEFSSLSPSSIAACICVDLQDRLCRKLTDNESEMVDEALMLFGVEEKEQTPKKLTEKQAYVMDLLKHNGGEMTVSVGQYTGYSFATLNSLKRKGLIKLFQGQYKTWKLRLIK